MAVADIIYYQPPSFKGEPGGEPNRAKPRELGRFFPARHRAQIKIAPYGETVWAPVAHPPPERGYFNSAPFSQSKQFYIRQNTGISPHFARTGCFGHSSGRGARIKFLKELSYGSLSA
jgi:hypothetical protein